MFIDSTTSVAPPRIAPSSPPVQITPPPPPPPKVDPALRPNPQIEFDPKLRLVVLEFRNGSSNTVTRYPDAAAPPAPTAKGVDSTA